jgi:hypothetical protein
VGINEKVATVLEPVCNAPPAQRNIKLSSAYIPSPIKNDQAL